MTVSVQDTVFRYTANGITTPFAYSCLVLAEADLVVTVDGVEATAGFTISGIGSDTGGNVVFTTAPANGASVIVRRLVALERTTDYQQHGDWLADVVNPDFDRLWMAEQQQAEQIDRSIKFPVADGALTTELPPAATRAGKLQGFDALGNVIAVVPIEQTATALQALLALFSGSSLVGWIQSGVGAVIRLVQDKLRDTVSVRDFIDTTIDGTTSNQTGIAAAVAAAYAAGARLYWPVGTYVSTATIPNLHDVEHFGKGIIKRGTDTFAVNPQGKSTQQNKFYISTTGSASNDGLSASEPMATFAQAFTQLTNYDLSAGTWNVIAAAGTYGGSTVQSFTKPSKNRVVVRGPDVGGHPNVPTCIIDGTGGATYSHGLRATESTFVQFQDILFQNFTNATTGTRIGALADVGSDLYTKNVHATNCDWSGVYASDATLRQEGGIIQTCQYGVTSYHSRATVGYNGAAGANRPIIKNCTLAGIYWAKLSMGHIDYCNIEDNPIGVYLDDNARAHGVNNNYKRNAYHVRFETGSRYLNDTDVYNEGTADAATSTTHDIRAYCGEDGEQRFAYSEVRIELDRTGYTHTGTTAKTTISTPYTLPAYRLAWAQSKLRVKVFGVHTSVSAGGSVGLDLGATQAALLAVTAAPSAGVGFVAEFEIHPTSVTVQRCAGRLDSSGQSSRIANSGIAADNTAALAVKVTAQLANAADTLTINRIEVFLAA